MVKYSNIIYYLRLRELGLLRKFSGNIVILPRPNKKALSRQHRDNRTRNQNSVSTPSACTCVAGG